MLQHDPEKWSPVFGKDHAQSKSCSPVLIRLFQNLNHGANRRQPNASYCGDAEGISCSGAAALAAKFAAGAGAAAVAA
jgi:hypothetical protein